MATRRRKKPARGRPRNPLDAIRAAVAGLGCREEERDSYLAFGQELFQAMTRPPVPDFEEQAKRVVAKWFKRGLSGKLLWELGCAIIHSRFGKTADSSQPTAYGRRQGHPSPYPFPQGARSREMSPLRST
jgi:hypothetical protein